MGLFSRLADRFRGASPGSMTSAVVEPVSLWAQFNRQGGNLTPADVSNILRTADGGDPSSLVDLANDLRQKDGHLHAVLATRENALSALPLSVEPFVERGEREPTDRDAEVAAFVEEALEGAAGNGQDVRATADLIPHMNGATYHGYAVAEIVWRREGRLLLPGGFAPVDQRRFAFRSNDGRLVFKDSPPASAFGNGIDLMAEYPGQFLQHQPRINGDVAVREGLSHLLVWPALFRNWDLIDWLRLAELAWKPWRIGKLLGQAGDKDKTDLVTALNQLTSAGIAIQGPNVELQLLWPGQEGGGRTGSTHKELAEWLGAEISKAVIGQTLTTEAGSRGARSLGEVHDRVRRDIRDQDARAVAATLRRDLVRPLVLLNYGPTVPLPTVAFQTEDAADLTSFADAIKVLKDAGLRIPLSHVYDVTGIPTPQDDDAVLGDGVEGEDEPDDEDDEDAEDVDVSELDEDDESEADDESDDSE